MTTSNCEIKLISQEIHKNVLKVDLWFRIINLDFGFKLAVALKKLFSQSSKSGFFFFIEEESICASLVKLIAHKFVYTLP